MCMITDQGKPHAGLRFRRRKESQLWDDPFCTGKEPRMPRYGSVSMCEGVFCLYMLVRVGGLCLLCGSCNQLTYVSCPDIMMVQARYQSGPG